MCKALNDLAPAQSPWLHIFTHSHIHATTLATSKLSAILQKGYSSLGPTYLFMLFSLYPRKPLLLFFSWHTLFLIDTTQNLHPPESFSCLMSYLPNQVKVLFLYAFHSILFIALPASFHFYYYILFT